MVRLPGGVLDGGQNVFPLEKRIVSKDLFVRSSRRQQIEDI